MTAIREKVTALRAERLRTDVLIRHMHTTAVPIRRFRPLRRAAAIVL